MTKTVTKKQLLAAACGPIHRNLIEGQWPLLRKRVPITEVVRRAARADIPFHTIGVLIQILDPENWVTVVRGPNHRIDYKASVERYLKREEDKVFEEEEARAGHRPFVPQYWWEGSFAKWMIGKGMNPTWPFAPPWYPRHVSERGPLGWDPANRKEKTVTKYFTKKQLLDAVCGDRYKKIIEIHWPAGQRSEEHTS